MNLIMEAMGVPSEENEGGEIDPLFIRPDILCQISRRVHQHPVPIEIIPPPCLEETGEVTLIYRPNAGLTRAEHGHRSSLDNLVDFSELERSLPLIHRPFLPTRDGQYEIVNPSNEPPCWVQNAPDFCPLFDYAVPWNIRNN